MIENTQPVSHDLPTKSPPKPSFPFTSYLFGQFIDVDMVRSKVWFLVGCSTSISSSWLLDDTIHVKNAIIRIILVVIIVVTVNHDIATLLNFDMDINFE